MPAKTRTDRRAALSSRENGVAGARIRGDLYSWCWSSGAKWDGWFEELGLLGNFQYV